MKSATEWTALTRTIDAYIAQFNPSAGQVVIDLRKFLDHLQKQMSIWGYGVWQGSGVTNRTVTINVTFPRDPATYAKTIVCSIPHWPKVKKEHISNTPEDDYDRAMRGI